MVAGMPLSQTVCWSASGLRGTADGVGTKILKLFGYKMCLLKSVTVVHLCPSLLV